MEETELKEGEVIIEGPGVTTVTAALKTVIAKGEEEEEEDEVEESEG